MGQQQLLLLVLGIVIVDLAVVVGIQAFGENQRKTTQDGMVNDAVRIASDVQAWSLKAPVFGGPSEGTGFTEFGGIGTLGYELDEQLNYVTANGYYSASATDASCVEIISVDRASGDAGNFSDPEIFVSALVKGARPEDVEVSPNELLQC